MANNNQNQKSQANRGNPQPVRAKEPQPKYQPQYRPSWDNPPPEIPGMPGMPDIMAQVMARSSDSNPYGGRPKGKFKFNLDLSGLTNGVDNDEIKRGVNTYNILSSIMAVVFLSLMVGVNLYYSYDKTQEYLMQVQALIITITMNSSAEYVLMSYVTTPAWFNPKPLGTKIVLLAVLAMLYSYDIASTFGGMQASYLLKNKVPDTVGYVVIGALSILLPFSEVGLMLAWAKLMNDIKRISKQRKEDEKREKREKGRDDHE